MSARSHRLRDLAFACGLFVLLLLFFWPVTVGSKTLLPADVLYLRQPWRDYAPAGAPSVPQNSLVTDLVLENYVWKQFILQCLRERQLPLWNPYILSGQPFLAAGQHSALYPFTLITYIFPLPRAYGLFTIFQLLVAGLSLYCYARTIRLSHFAAAVGGLAFAFSGFLLIRTVFPMIIAAAAWLPFLLAMTERLLQSISVEERRTWRERVAAPLPWLVLGSLGLGSQFLAGHAEILYYNLLVLVAYGVWRAAGTFVRRRRWRALLAFGAAFAMLLGLGAAVGAAQFVPLFELVRHNFREGSTTYQQIISWRYPARRLIAFLMPDFFGNPTHHSYVDLYTGQTVSAWKNALGQSTNAIFWASKDYIEPTIYWGIKNYVEGGAYCAILALLLALVGAVHRPRRQAWFFIVLGLFSLSLVFGLPTYALVFQLPGIRQLHSPFRWVFPYTVSVAVLAAMGAESLAESVVDRKKLRLPTTLGALALLGGVGAVAAVGLARALPQRILPLADRLVASLAKAPQTFADGRMFISYQARNLLLFAVCALGAALALLWPCLRRPRGRLHRSFWPYALLAVLVLDPALWLRGFQPEVDPAPLNLEPPVIQFLQAQERPFRITTFDSQDAKPLPANTNMYFGLEDVRGYDSIITKDYAQVMSLVEPQELEFNQITRLKRAESLDSPILDLLNVRYVLSEEPIDRPGYTLVRDGSLRVYRNDDALPRAFVTFRAETFADRDDLLQALKTADPREAVLLEQQPESFAHPVGPLLFTVSGDMLAPNSGRACAIDAANSAPYLQEMAFDDPIWGTGKDARGDLLSGLLNRLGISQASEHASPYRGILLAELWNRCGAVGATQAIVTSTDGRQVTIARDDLLQWPILVVTQFNREPLTPEQGGPARLAFPPELADRYPESAWLSSIKTIELGGPTEAAPAAPEVEYVETSANQVQLHVDMPAPGFLVLADTYFPDWVAYTRPDSQEGEQELTVLRADGTVRAVQLPAGPQTVRFKYSPTSVKLGFFISFMGVVSLGLLAAAWLWARIYSPEADERTALRVAKNTVAPLSLQLLNKAIDMVFMMLALRLLGPEAQGKYYFAIAVYALLEIVTNFGLNTLLTREVARNHQDGNRYLWNTSILRLGLLVLAAPLLGAFLVLYHPMPRDTALAIILFAVGLVPASVSAGLSAVFMAFEVMVIPAVVTTITTLLKVSLGMVALLLGWSFVGLAGASIVVNLITMAILLGLVVVLFFRPHAEVEPALQREMVGTASPLMANHLLAYLFFKVDVFLLQRAWGETVLGWYSVSYKLVDAVGIIPPTFTMAIFPLMSRFANSSREQLRSAYVLSIKLLFSVALLIALLASALAYPLASLMGGAAYLPHSAIALQIIVWYMPLGFINGVTQYVLIALDQQRFLTKAYVIGLACGLGANLLLIPRFSYQGAATVHILSEMALLIAFYVGVRRHLGPIPWLGLTWRPALAATASGTMFWLLRARPQWAVVPLATALYLALLLVLGTFDAGDRALLQQVVPLQRVWQRTRQLLLPRQSGAPQP